MAFNPSDLLKLGAESFTTATAYVKIRDLRSLGNEGIKLVAAEKASGGSALGMSGLNKIPGANKAVDNLKNKATEAAAAAVSQVGGSTIGSMLGNLVGSKLGINGLTNDDYDKVFKVQFNPSSLQLSGQGGGEVVQKSSYAQSKEGTTIEVCKTKPHLEMSVQLIFDGVGEQTYKSFASDLANFSSTNIINQGLDVISSAVSQKLLGGSEGITVQQAVEGFVGAMRNKYTRQVCFEWGDLYYEGEMKSVNATYTMFDSVGRPVRATCNMSIYLQDENVTNSDLGYWETAYDEVFGGGSLDLSGGKALTAAKSLLNF